MKTQTLRWGILSTAKIGREKVIPALQKSKYIQVTAIASRNIETAKETAKLLNIPKSYGSYEELLADKEIDAIYIPLPNHLHVEWAIKAMQAGKHVLCEKPIGLTSKEAQTLLMATNEFPHLKIMEAFMYRYHPQWVYAKELVTSGKIGDVKIIESFFSYYNIDPKNIRNRVEVGGGAMMDIGCYCVSLARFLFGEEPKNVLGIVDFDPEMKTDRLSTGILNFSKGNSTFTCSTQLMPHQRVNIVGNKGRLEIEIPFNMPPDQKAKVFLYTSNGKEEILFDPIDQYTLQADAFSKAILNDEPVPYGLQDAVNNMKVIEAIFESAKQKSWIEIKN